MSRLYNNAKKKNIIYMFIMQRIIHYTFDINRTSCKKIFYVQSCLIFGELRGQSRWQTKILTQSRQFWRSDKDLILLKKHAVNTIINASQKIKFIENKSISNCNNETNVQLNIQQKSQFFNFDHLNFWYYFNNSTWKLKCLWNWKSKFCFYWQIWFDSYLKSNLT